MTDDRRIFEYFVVAGLPDNPKELTPGAQECGYKNIPPQAPVTDLCVIFPTLGEKVPDGFTCIESTQSGYPADLNHGSLRTPPCFLCYRRGYHKPPLVDIGVLHEGKGERVMVDSQILQTTPFGRPANVNNASQGIYLTYRRASENSPPNLLAVTDVCVILMNKGELAPHTFCRVNKNLNRGMVGSDVYICYKKSSANTNRIPYEPAILDRFPSTEEEEFPLPPTVPIFCLPLGAVLECWPAKCQSPNKVFLTFVLTDKKGRKFYGASVTFFEPYDKAMTPEQLERLGVGPEAGVGSGTVSDNSSTNDPAEQMTFQMNKAICVVSRYPFFMAFKRFLFYLHRMSVTGIYNLPIERYVSHLMYEVPFPTPRRPRVLVQLGNETISFDNHDDTPLPLSGASFIDFLKAVGAENAMYLFLLTLFEQKILIHSLRPYLPTSVAEAICSIIFPFHWQCPYIPQCPLDLAGVLHAPLPFIAGVDSRYFELYEDPPKDVTCVDLDTATISMSEIRKNVKLSMLPRRPAKLLRQTLDNLVSKVHQEDWNVTTMRNSTEFMPIDVDYKLVTRRRTLELEIQEAFLRFMASIMKGYRNYLKPIIKPVKSAFKERSTDTGSLFDIDGFLRTRDRSGHEFYRRFSDTQSFIRFIEERSLLSDKNAYLAFFDECVEKNDPSNDKTPDARLLEYESSLNSNHTVFIAPPEPLPTTKEGETFSYSGFPKELVQDRFQLDSLVIPDPRIQPKTTPNRRRSGSFSSTTPAIGRTKQEAKSAQKTARQQAVSPVRWAKCILSYAYSLWFIYLPTYVKLSSSKTKALRTAFQVLDRMHNAHLSMLDEVCYRIMMQLCGQYGKPLMTVKVFMIMRQHGLQPNAITYGFYNRAVLEANWPSCDTVNAERIWTKLRHTVRAIALFKKLLRERRKRRTLSQFSHDSGADYALSQSSLLSSQSQVGVKQPNLDATSICTTTSKEQTEFEGGNIPEKGSPTDPGYHSQATEDSLSVDPANPEPEPQSTAVAKENTFRLSHSQLETFDEFRGRTRMVINPKSTLGSLSLHSYHSPAGLLITSSKDMQILKNEDKTTSRTATEIRSTIGLVGDVTKRAPIDPLRKPSVRRSFQPLLFQTGNDSGTPSPTSETPTQDFPTPTASKLTPFLASALGEDAHIIQQFEEQNRLRKEQQQRLPALNVTLEDDGDEANVLSSPIPALKSQTPTKVPRLPVVGEDPLGALEDDLPPPVTDTEGSSSPKLASPPSRAEILEMQKPFQDGMTGSGTSIASEEGKTGVPTSVSKPATPVTENAEGEELGDMQPSPSFSVLMNQAQAKMWSRMGDVMQKQQPSIDRLRSGMTSVMKEIRSFKALDQLSSPLKGSLSSLDIGADDMGRYEEYDGSWPGRREDGLDSFYRDPAFQLSSGETGSILSYDFTGFNTRPRDSLPPYGSSLSRASDGHLYEACLSTCTKCSSCNSLLYDEEIMAGWTSDESNLNTKCQFCARTLVPILTVRLRQYRFFVPDSLSDPKDVGELALPTQLANSWYVNPGRGPASKLLGQKQNYGSAVGRGGVGCIGSMDSLNSMPGTPLQNQRTQVRDSANRRRQASGEMKPSSGVNRQLFPESVMETSSEDHDGTMTNSSVSPLPTQSPEDAERNREVEPSSPVTATPEPEHEDEWTEAELADEADEGRGSGCGCEVSGPIKEDTLTVPFLSPLVLRKEMENLLVVDETALEHSGFMESNPILYWNLLYFFRRLSVPTHLSDWVPNAPSFHQVASQSDESNEKQAQGNEKQEEGRENRALMEHVVVRCVYDNSQAHDERSGKPIYLRQSETSVNDSGSPLVAALLLEQRALNRSVVAQILDYLTLPNLHKPIQLLINEHRRRIPVQASPSHQLPKHFSIYRDILFLALVRFGKEVRWDDFDREYSTAFAKLPPKIAGFLPVSDHPPTLAVRCCRKIFIPLDVC